MADIGPVKKLDTKIVNYVADMIKVNVADNGKSLSSIFQNGEVKSLIDAMFKSGTLKDIKNLNSTLAGSIAQQMDAQDGTVDGYVDASVWNQYADEHGGNQVQNKISVVNAMNSITTYIVRESAKLKEAVFAQLQNEAENMVDSETESPAKEEANQSEEA